MMSAPPPAGTPPGLHTSAAPPPPAGPGVRPPFVAPPTDGSRRRLWVGLSSAAVVLVLLCGGGITGFVALARGTIHERSVGATKAVTTFLNELKQNDLVSAYRAQCQDLRQQYTFAQFSEVFADFNLSGFVVETPEISADETIVPASLRFTDGDIENERFAVIVESDGVSRVCGEAR